MKDANDDKDNKDIVPDMKWEQSFTKWKSAVPVIQALKHVDLDAEHELEFILSNWLKSKSSDLQTKIYNYASAKSGIFDPNDGMTKQEFKNFCFEVKMEDKSGPEQFDYAMIFFEKNSTKCVYWLEKSAKQKYSNAQFSLGRIYQDGDDNVPKDCKRAFEYYTLAANQGNSNAQNHLGICYEYGIGVDKDIKQAIKYYTLAADQKNDYGNYNLGRCYENGIGGVVKDIKQAVKYYTLAANDDNAYGQNNLGRCCQYGIGTTKDEKRAFEYFTLSANKNHDVSQFNLANCYRNGIGTTRDYDKAIEFYTRSANNGFSAAKDVLLFCSENKIDGRIDVKQNLEFLSRKPIDITTYPL